jgi:hypothetical protein
MTAGDCGDGPKRSRLQASREPRGDAYGFFLKLLPPFQTGEL